MSLILADLRHALAALARRPLFAVVAVASLALGIGTSTGIFAMVNGILLRSLPVPRAGELRNIAWKGGQGAFHAYSGDLTEGGGASTGGSFSWPTFQALRDAAAGQAEVFGYTDLYHVTFQTSETFAASGLMVSGGFFKGLGVQAALGRTFGPGEASGDEAFTVVLGDSFWRRRFSADPGVIGRSVTLNGRPHTIIGVLPAWFTGIQPGSTSSFYTPISTGQALLPGFRVSEPDTWYVRIMARVPARGDTSLHAALDTTFRRMTASTSETPGIRILDGRRGRKTQDPDHKSTLLLMLGGGALLLLVTCANIAGLTLTRGADRQHDLGVRMALGASRLDLVRPVLVESLLLALVGGAWGLLLAGPLRDALSRLLAENPDGLSYDMSLQPKVLAFTGALTLLAGALSGLVPALRAAAARPMSHLRHQPGRTTGRPRLGRAVIIVQVALSLVLLSWAGLMLRSMNALLRLDPGFDVKGLFLVDVETSALRTASLSDAYLDEASAGLAALPGVRGTGFVQATPWEGTWTMGIRLPGMPGPSRNHNALVEYVDEGFFTALGVPMAEGRSFTRADAGPVAIVNRAFQRVLLEGRNPLGMVVAEGSGDPCTVVGVCPDLRLTGLRNPAEPTLFLPYRRSMPGPLTFLVRADGTPDALRPAMTRVLKQADSRLPVSSIQTLAALKDRNMRQERLLATLASCLAAFAVFLSSMGLYGLVASEVARRHAEFGIRMALGAGPTSIRCLVWRETGLLAGGGIILGLLGAWTFNRLLASFLFGVTYADSRTLGGMSILFLAVAFLATLPPIRRAARTDPAEALRAE